MTNHHESAASSKRSLEPIDVNALVAIAGDLLATRAKAVIDQLAAVDWEPLEQLKEALATYSEVRLSLTMAEQADTVLRHIEEKAPETQRSGEARQ